MRIVLLGLTIGLLGVGCTSRHDQMVEQGFPVAYADGFAAGCHSGKKAGGSLFDQFDKDKSGFLDKVEFRSLSLFSSSLLLLNLSVMQ